MLKSFQFLLCILVVSKWMWHKHHAGKGTTADSASCIILSLPSVREFSFEVFRSRPSLICLETCLWRLSECNGCWLPTQALPKIFCLSIAACLSCFCNHFIFVYGTTKERQSLFPYRIGHATISFTLLCNLGLILLGMMHSACDLTCDLLQFICKKTKTQPPPTTNQSPCTKSLLLPMNKS